MHLLSVRAKNLETTTLPAPDGVSIDSLWTTQQTAAYLNCTVRKLIDDRVRGGSDAIPFVRVSSRMVRYIPRRVQDWVTSRMQPAS